jgi:PAS domain S-box-containing protein
MATSSSHSGLCNFLFRSNPVAMFLYDGGSLRIVAANEAARAKYGYTASEFRSMTVGDLHPCGDAPSTDGDSLDAPEAPSCLLWTHVTSSGRLFPVEIRLAPFVRGRRNLCLLSAVDASAWSEAKLRLIRSEEIHRSLVEECPFGIYRFDVTTAHYEQANPALLQLLGYSLEDFCATPRPDIYVDANDRQRLFAQLCACKNIRDFETCFRRKDGAILRVSISGYLCTDPETGQQYVQNYVRDITRQRELEEKLRQSHSLEVVGRLAGGVAHDFNNITQSISLSCELALQNELDPALKSKLKDIMKQSMRAADITRQLLAFSRRQVLQPSIVNINDCVRNALCMLTCAVGAEVAVELNLDESVKPIFIDPDQLAIVLLHLANNARAAMPRGGQFRISTAAWPENLDELKNGCTAPCAVLTVSDTGIGMDDKTLARIFEPFFSTKNTTLTAGLGLSTSHGIISQSNGRIECESSPGNGTTFRIYLPIAGSRQKGASRVHPSE